MKSSGVTNSFPISSLFSILNGTFSIPVTFSKLSHFTFSQSGTKNVSLFTMENSTRPLIFVTNDDSLHAKGIASLVAVAREFGEVVVIAPDKPQSGMGHAITISHPLRLYRSELFEGIEAYSCSGTPVDCVKLAIYEVLHRKPDLIVSGVNHGLNSSTNVLYSGIHL